MNDGATAIAKYLNKNSSLHYLDLSYNRIGTDGSVEKLKL